MEPEQMVVLKQEEKYRFEASFEGKSYPSVQVDESSPPGTDTGPNPSRMLAVAVGHCLSSSLLFCLERSRAEVGPVTTRVRTTLARNDKGRWRIGGIDVEIDTEGRGPEGAEKLARCREMFEDFCIVTESVRHGVPVRVTVGGLPTSPAERGAPASAIPREGTR